ncbi:transmembrane 9 superfamily member 4-like [Dorcoceras hygrometricum]|uniref:Transmembrane 9 superfamily member 4-like n=1 Tax=Dorcoceras hygrometricum TaxID=472368 RepID=A0A2Z7ADL0_9LAMI|nr:transmembrane 9 superfamily member 4-like [Dorcoceras hygrometricum]
MASSYYTNTLHVNFESVLAMDDPGMVSIFQALMASGLEGFLGCPAVVYEATLVYFFENASVRDGVVVSTVHGVTVEISEQLFAETFELPVEGLSDLSKIPKDLVFDARSIVSLSGEPVRMTGKKNEMKFEYRLLCDIMAKTILVKVGSFNAITMEKKLNFFPDDGSSAVDLKIMDRLSDIHSFVLEELKEQAKAHGLTWKKTCCSKFFEGFPRDHGAVIARTNTNTPSKCWIRTMILVDGVWVVEPCSDHWVKIPRPTVNNDVPRQLYYLDTLPAISTFFKLMKKRWVDVCLEVGEFFVSGKLLPVGSVNFCRSLEIVEPVSCFVSRQPTILSLRLSQFCTVSVQYSLFNGLNITDIRSFVSSIVFERTALRDVQRIQSSVSALPSVQSSYVSVSSQKVQLAFSSVVEDEDNQMEIDQGLVYPTTTSDSSMNFIHDDTILGDAATSNQPSLPTVSNISTYLDDFRNLLWQRLDAQSEDIRHIGDSHNDVLSRINTLDKGLRDVLLQQGEDLRKLIQNVRQDGRTVDDVQTLRFNEFRKGFLAHSAAITADSMDFRKDLEHLMPNAQAQETLNHITDQLEFDEPTVEVTAEEIKPPSIDDVDNIIEQVLDETAHIEADEEDHGVGTSDVGDQPAGTTDDSVPWFDLPYEVLIARDSERVFEMGSDTEDEEMETIDVGDQQLQAVDAAVSRADAAANYFVEAPVEETETEAGELSAYEAKSVEDILMTIPVDVPFPSTSVEITKIILGKDIKIPGVDERTWYLASLPKIKPEEKGKKPLQEKDPVKGHPVKEQIFLILADIEFLVKLRKKIIDDIDRFFNSFRFKKLASLKVEDISAKEELVLSWGEAESTRVALNRRMYILTKYRELLLQKFLESRKLNFFPDDGSSAVDLKIMDRLSDIHSFVLEELKEQAKAHGLTWKKTCCSKFFEGFPRDHGAVIARTNTNTPSKCWIRTMILVDGVRVVEPCSDHWVTIPKPIVHNEVAATRNDLLEFSAQAQETLNHITDQLSELIAYINCGGNDKKGEVSSSRPQPPPDDQNRGNGNTGGDSVRTSDIVDRFSGSMSKEGRGRGRSGGNRSGYSKRTQYNVVERSGDLLRIG